MTFSDFETIKRHGLLRWESGSSISLWLLEWTRVLSNSKGHYSSCHHPCPNQNPSLHAGLSPNCWTTRYLRSSTAWSLLFPKWQSSIRLRLVKLGQWSVSAVANGALNAGYGPNNTLLYPVKRMFATYLVFSESFYVGIVVQQQVNNFDMTFVGSKGQGWMVVFISTLSHNITTKSIKHRLLHKRSTRGRHNTRGL